MSVLVRVADIADAEAIARAHVDAWRVAYRGILPQRILDGLTAGGRESQWRDRLGQAGSGLVVLVAEVAGEVVGFVTYVVPSRDPGEPPDVGEIPALYVSPDAWRTGSGSALLAAAENAMTEEGCPEAILWMLGGNTARAFYERQGWRDDGGRRPSQYFPEEGQLEEIRFRKRL